MALNELSFDGAAQARAIFTPRSKRSLARHYLDHLPQCYVQPEVLNPIWAIVLELKSKVENELLRRPRKKLPSLRSCAAVLQTKPNVRQKQRANAA
jgi:hypothetical protein